MVDVDRSTVVSAPRDEVWAVVSTFAGVNDELMPLCRMRPPGSLAGRTIDSWRSGERAACWLLAGGLVPFDRHVLSLDSVEPGAGFVEESASWLQRRWRHERTLSDEGHGTRVTDHLVVEPRIAAMAPVAGVLVRWVFAHRHRRLVRRFGRAA